jgi:hypothetical protein
MFELFVVHPFHGYAKGQHIIDPAEVAKLLAERDKHVVKVPTPVQQPAA